MTKKDWAATQNQTSALKELLREFNCKLGPHGEGLTAYWPKAGGIDTLYFTEREWEFLEPLLKELRELRRQKSAA